MNYLSKIIVLFLTLTTISNSYANLVVHVSEEQFMKTLEDDSVVIQILKQNNKPKALPRNKWGSSGDAHKIADVHQIIVEPEMLYTYITHKGGFYFVTTSETVLYFNNLVIEGNSIDVNNSCRWLAS